MVAAATRGESVLEVATEGLTEGTIASPAARKRVGAMLAEAPKLAESLDEGEMKDHLRDIEQTFPYKVDEADALEIELGLRPSVTTYAADLATAVKRRFRYQVRVGAQEWLQDHPEVSRLPASVRASLYRDAYDQAIVWGKAASHREGVTRTATPQTKSGSSLDRLNEIIKE